MGIVCGYFIDKLVIKYDESVEKWWHNVVKYILGIGITIGLYYLLMAFYIDLSSYYALVFFILAFVASTIIPVLFQIIFKKSKIESGESENENVQKAATQELSIEQTNNDKAKLDKVSKVTKTSGKKKPTNQIKIEKLSVLGEKNGKKLIPVKPTPTRLIW